MNNKNKFILSIVGVFASVVLMVATAILVEEAVVGVKSAVVLVIISAVSIVVAIAFAAKVDYETGVYECRNCGCTFKPKFNAYLFAPHSLTTRYLKCPDCERNTWCERKISENAE